MIKQETYIQTVALSNGQIGIGMYLRGEGVEVKLKTVILKLRDYVAI